MRVWIDLTNSPHVLVMRPVVELLRKDGHDVRVTARDFAQTLGLLERFGIEHTAIGHHRGEHLSAKALGLASRSGALVRWARRHGPFDIAIGHGSNDVSVAARLLGIPCSTMFDYEWAAVQHHVNCRLARAVVVPDAIPPERLYGYGAKGKVRAYEGLKEEYYLADFEPSDAVLSELGLDRERPIVVVRTPPEVSLYHRFENDLFSEVLDRLRTACAPPSPAVQPPSPAVQPPSPAVQPPSPAVQPPSPAVQPPPDRPAGGAAGVQAVVLPRTEEQRAQLRAVAGFTVPERAIDAQSLIAYADLVISAGGTMNREAVALGTPVYTTFEGRLGALDERLLAEGRLRRLERAEQLSLAKRDPAVARARVRRDPRLLIDLLLSPLAASAAAR